MAVIEQALEESEQLATAAIIRLDELAREEKETRANVSARPRISYEIFAGDIGKFPTFSQNQQELYKMFANPKAADGGGAQQLFQLSKILSPELARTVMSFSGAERGADKAVSWMELKCNSPHLLTPKVYEEIKKPHSCKKCNGGALHRGTCSPEN